MLCEKFAELISFFGKEESVSLSSDPAIKGSSHTVCAICFRLNSVAQRA